MLALDWVTPDTEPYLPLASTVARMCRWLALEWQQELDSVVDVLIQSANMLDEFPDRQVIRPRQGAHVLTRERDHSPVYVALAEEPGSSTCWALAPLRVVLLRDWCSPNRRHNLQSLCEAIIRWGNAPEDSGRSEFDHKLSQLAQARDWVAALSFADRFRLQTDNKLLRSRINLLIRAMRSIQTTVHRTFKTELTPRPVGKGVYTIPSLADDDETDEDPIHLSPKELLTPKLLRSPISETRQIQLAAFGYRHRLAQIWTGASPESLYPTEARRILRFAQEVFNNSMVTLEQRSAAALIICSMLSGQRIDALLSPLLDIPVRFVHPHINIVVKNRRARLIVPLIGHGTFAKNHGKSYDRDTRSYLSIYIPIYRYRVELKTFFKRIQLGGSSLETAINDIKNSVKHLTRNWRKEVRDCSETRLRGSLMQCVFNINHDLPLVQMLFHEPLNCSTASLAYYSTTQAPLQKIYNQAIQHLYGIVPDGDHERPDQRVGSPLASAIVRRLDQLNPPILERKRGRPSLGNIRRWHNAWCDFISWWLYVATVNRGNRDFPQITGNQISPSLGCIIISDKPSDPQSFRRVVAIPEIVCHELIRYQDHLRKVLDHARALQAPEEVLRAIADAIAGNGPLLFTFGEGVDGLTIKPVNIDMLWKRFGISDLPRNCLRHAFSSWVREQFPSTPGVFIEAQLGHEHGAGLFSADSCVSVKEWRDELDGPLTAFLNALGFQPSSNRDIGSEINEPWCAGANKPLSPSLRRLELDTFRDDSERIRSLYRFDTPPPMHHDVDEVVTTVLQERVPDYTQPRFAPTDITVDEEAVAQMARRTLELTHEDQHGAVHMRLKNRLLWHRAAHGWRVVMPQRLYRYVSHPPDITVASFIAHETLLRFENQLMRSLDTGRTHQLGLTAIALIIWGRIHSQALLVATLRGLHDACWARPLPDQLFIPVSIEDTTSSICLTGPAAAAAVGLLRKFPDPGSLRDELRQLNDHVCSALPAEFIPAGRSRSKALTFLFDLARLARRLDAPGIVCAAESGYVTTRQAPIDQLLPWLLDTHNPKRVDFKPQAIRTRRRVRSTPARTQREKTAYNTLTLTFRNLPKFYDTIGISRPPTRNGPSQDKHRLIRKAISAWLTRCDNKPTAIVDLIARWTLHLCGPHANLINNRRLKINSIRKYLHQVQEPLINALAGIPIEEIDEEFASEALESELMKNPDAAVVGPRINRMFHDLRKHWDVPKVFVSTNFAKRYSRSLIDAALVPKSAQIFALDLLHISENNEASSIAWRRHSSDSKLALTMALATGARRSEIKNILYDDLRSYQNTTLLAIRPHPGHQLKSRSARRTIPISITTSSKTINSKTRDPLLASFNAYGTATKRDPFSLTTYALRCSTGTYRTRVHHLRHTRVSLRFHALFSKGNLIDRLVGWHALRASIGHASNTTTAKHYCHCIQYIGSVYYGADLPSKKILARLLALKGETEYAALRKRISRINNNLSHSSGAVTAYLSDRLWSPAEPSSELCMTPVNEPETPELSVETLIQLTTHLARGRFLSEIIDSLPLTSSQLNEIYGYIRGLQNQLGWTPISTQSLKQLSDYTDNIFADNDSQYIRRNIARSVMESWNCKLRVSDLPQAIHYIGDQLAGFNWRSTKLIFPIMGAEMGDRFSKTVVHLCAPIDVNLSGCAETGFYLTLALRDGSNISNPSVTVRFILFNLLLISHIAKATGE